MARNDEEEIHRDTIEASHPDDNEPTSGEPDEEPNEAANTEQADEDSEDDEEADADPPPRPRPFFVEMHRRLDATAQRRTQERELARLRELHDVLRTCGSMPELIRRFSAKPHDYPFRDAVLVVLVAASHANPRSPAPTILLRVCLGLIACFARKRRPYVPVREHDDLGSRCVLAFVGAVATESVLRRRQNMWPRIRSLMKDRIEKELARDERVQEADAGLEDELAWMVPAAELAAASGEVPGFFDLISKTSKRVKRAPVLPDEIEDAYRLVDSRLPAGFLDPVERDLLVRVKGCGERSASVAKAHGIKAATARQILARAIHRIEAHLASIRPEEET